MYEFYYHFDWNLSNVQISCVYRIVLDNGRAILVVKKGTGQ